MDGFTTHHTSPSGEKYRVIMPLSKEQKDKNYQEWLAKEAEKESKTPVTNYITFGFKN